MMNRCRRFRGREVDDLTLQPRLAHVLLPDSRPAYLPGRKLGAPPVDRQHLRLRSVRNESTLASSKAATLIAASQRPIYSGR